VGKGHPVQTAVHTLKPLYGLLATLAGTGEVGRKDLKVFDLAGAEPFPAPVFAQFVRSRYLVAAQDIAVTEVVAVDVGFDDPEITAVLKLQEITFSYGFVYGQVHTASPPMQRSVAETPFYSAGQLTVQKVNKNYKTSPAPHTGRGGARRPA
jgi:hypothetical protein